MNIFTILLSLFLILIFVPLPIKITFLYTETNYYIKIYNHNLLSKSKPKKIKKQTIRKKKNKKSYIKTSLKSIPPNILLNFLDKNLYKPKIKIKGKIDYSLNDAALTAISYGIISSILPFIYKVITIIFNPKKINLPINPLFKNKFLVNIDINSIIFLSIAQIIYILFILLKAIIYKKEVTLYRENI